MGGLCFAARSSNSCLSVLSSWTSCNNINGPLNRLLCCAARAWVTSHTCTLALSERRTHMRGGGGGHSDKPPTHAHGFHGKITRSHARDPAGGSSAVPPSTNTHRNRKPHSGDLCSTVIGHLKPCCQPARQPVCLSPQFVCLFVNVCGQKVGLLVFVYGSLFVRVNHQAGTNTHTHCFRPPLPPLI